jgi:flagellar FliL protein
MAKAAEVKKEKEEGAEAPKKKGNKMIPIIAVALLVLLVGGGMGFAFMGGGKETEPEEVHVEPLLKIAKLEPFIVNLGEHTAFIKVSLLLEYDQHILDSVIAGHGSGGGHGYGGGAAGGGAPPDPTALPEVMLAREPMVRDAIIRVLASKRAVEVLTIDGKERLKEEIVESVNEALQFSESTVTNVYFAEFIVQ